MDRVGAGPRGPVQPGSTGTGTEEVRGLQPQPHFSTPPHRPRPSTPTVPSPSWLATVEGSSHRGAGTVGASWSTTVEGSSDRGTGRVGVVKGALFDSETLETVQCLWDNPPLTHWAPVVRHRPHPKSGGTCDNESGRTLRFGVVSVGTDPDRQQRGPHSRHENRLRGGP